MTTDLQPLPEKQMLSGFRNMLRIENSRWWNLRNILTQSAAWLASVNFILAMPLIVAPMVDSSSPTISLEMGVEIFLGVFSLVLAIASVILLQGSLVVRNSQEPPLGFSPTPSREAHTSYQNWWPIRVE